MAANQAACRALASATRGGSLRAAGAGRHVRAATAAAAKRAEAPGCSGPAACCALMPAAWSASFAARQHDWLLAHALDNGLQVGQDEAQGRQHRHHYALQQGDHLPHPTASRSPSASTTAAQSCGSAGCGARGCHWDAGHGSPAIWNPHGRSGTPDAHPVAELMDIAKQGSSQPCWQCWRSQGKTLAPMERKAGARAACPGVAERHQLQLLLGGPAVQKGDLQLLQGVCSDGGAGGVT